MSCDGFEKLIALDVEGDLTAAEAARLRRHLDGCAACRRTAVELRESQAALKEFSAGELDEDALASWRRGVMARAESEPRRRAMGWRWALALAAAVVLFLIGSRALWRQTPGAPPDPPPPVANLMPSPPLVQTPRAQPARRRKQVPRAPAQPSEPLMVKLETADPNVVIYWTVERRLK